MCRKENEYIGLTACFRVSEADKYSAASPHVRPSMGPQNQVRAPMTPQGQVRAPITPQGQVCAPMTPQGHTAWGMLRRVWNGRIIYPYTLCTCFLCSIFDCNTVPNTSLIK